MRFADLSRGRPFAKDPAVVRFQDRYLMYYSLPPFQGARTGWAIGVAESTDLDRWTKIGDLLPEQDCERNGVCAPGALVRNGRVHLFYQTYGNGPKDALCHAVSEDGVHFVRHPTNPVFAPTGSWHSGRAIDADVVAFDDALLLYFATRDPQMQVQMLGVASAPLDSDYGREAWTQRCTGPILKPELPWEQTCIEAPAVMARDGRLYMFYAGAYNNRPQQIGLAVSDDGLAWTRLSNTPILPAGAPGSWHSCESGHPYVFVDDDGTTHLFFQGNDDRGQTWYLSRAVVHWADPLPRLELCDAP